MKGRSRFLNINSLELYKELIKLEDDELVLFTDPSLNTGVYAEFFSENLQILNDLTRQFKFNKVCIIGEHIGKEGYYEPIFNKKYLRSLKFLWDNGCNKRWIYLYSNKPIISDGLSTINKISLENKEVFQCAIPKNLILDIYNALDISKTDIIIDPFAGSNNICFYIENIHGNKYISSEINDEIFRQANIYKPK